MSAPIRDFTTFLATSGYISEVDAKRVREVVQQDSVPLGKVLVMSGTLSVKDLMTILAAQTEHPNERFGSIAVRLGLISPEQLGEALLRQSKVRVHPAQVVLTLELLDEERWREAMIEYVKTLESAPCTP
ncbi:MAG: hypothetical protein U1E65_16320 [Myxococcota bacterium]